MSQLNVNTITNEAGTGAPDFTTGLKVGGTSYPSVGPLSNRNKIINGAMTIDQRNAGAAVTPATATYTLDRWQAIRSAAPADRFSVQKNAGSVTPPAGFSSYLGVTSLSAYSVAANDFFQIKQLLEGFNVADLSYGTSAAKDITVSFWVRSSLTGNFGIVISWGSSAANQRSYPVLYAISAANTWEYKTVTIPGDTTMPAGGFETGNGAGIQVRFSLGGGATNAGTPGAWATANSQTVVGDTSVVGTNGATFYITGVQLEAGDTATPFEHRSFGAELALCQRYFQIVGGFGGPFMQSYQVTGQTSVYSALFPVVMRATPTAIKNGTWAVSNVNQPTTDFVSSVGFSLRAVATATGSNFFFPDSTDDTVTFSAEL